MGSSVVQIADCIPFGMPAPNIKPGYERSKHLLRSQDSSKPYFCYPAQAVWLNRCRSPQKSMAGYRKEPTAIISVRKHHAEPCWHSGYSQSLIKPPFQVSKRPP
ncbi:hypothetical protein GQ457_02G008930 [Hibiscus cannabinus]